MQVPAAQGKSGPLKCTPEAPGVGGSGLKDLGSGLGIRGLDLSVLDPNPQF